MRTKSTTIIGSETSGTASASRTNALTVRFAPRVLPKARGPLRTPIWRGQFEALKLERGDDNAAHERPGAQTRRRLPGIVWHDALKCFAVAGGGTKPDGVSASVEPVDLKKKGCARQPDPDFGGVDAVPVGALAFSKKKMDRACSAPAAVRRRIPPKLMIVTTFRMRLQFESGTHFHRCERGVTEIRKQMGHMDGLKRRDPSVRKPSYSLFCLTQ
jgi:hypothetical protein